MLRTAFLYVPGSVGTNKWDDPPSWDVSISPPGKEQHTVGKGRNITEGKARLAPPAPSTRCSGALLRSLPPERDSAVANPAGDLADIPLASEIAINSRAKDIGMNDKRQRGDSPITLRSRIWIGKLGAF
jgi:hypothetical protein